MKTTLLDIELAIMSYYDHREAVIVPNITEQSNLVAFEVDMLVLRKSNLAYGFEIKTSKADLKADFKKVQHTRFNQMHNGKPGIERYFGKFKYFYYAVPLELKQLALELIPDFCGLMVLETKEYPEHDKFYLAREAKSLFDYHWNEKQRYQLARLGTMRILSLKRTIAEQKNTIEYLRNSNK
jgi:hypothetical protein